MMETVGNSLNSHFDGIPANQQRLINFLKQSFSEEEIYALGRTINMEKDDYAARGMTKQQLCGSFVDSLAQRSLFDRLFILLQSPTFVRPRLYVDFSDIGIKEPLTDKKVLAIVENCFDKKANENKDSFATWLESCKKSMVLVLGKDNTPDAWKRLSEICDHLRQLGYSPILIKEQPDIGPLTNEEKMLAYAAVSRFILIEKSEPSGHIDEAHICAINRLVGIWLREEGKGDTWMQGDYEVSYTHIKGFSYSPGELEKAIRQGIEWAESYLTDKEDTLNALYPFRR